MCLQFGFVIFWRKDFGAKAAHKMLVKIGEIDPWWQHGSLICFAFFMKNHKIAKNSTSTKARENINTDF